MGKQRSGGTASGNLSASGQHAAFRPASQSLGGENARNPTCGQHGYYADVGPPPKDSIPKDPPVETPKKRRTKSAKSNKGHDSNREDHSKGLKGGKGKSTL